MMERGNNNNNNDDDDDDRSLTDRRLCLFALFSGGQVIECWVGLPCIGFHSGDDVTWKIRKGHSYTKVAALQSSTGLFYDGYNPLFAGRVQINSSTGMLYIGNQTENDSGSYMCEMPSNTDERHEPRRFFITLVVTSSNQSELFCYQLFPLFHRVNSNKYSNAGKHLTVQMKAIYQR